MALTLITLHLIYIDEANRALCDLSRLMEENKAVEIFAV